MSQEDQYLPCSAYANQPIHPTVAGFAAFTSEQEFYFAYTAGSERVLLKSEGYPTAKSRETGVQSVVNNLPNRDRYAIKSEGKKFYIILRAGNRKEIARSCSFATETEALALVEELVSGKVAALQTTVEVVEKIANPKVAATKTEKKQPKELPLEAFLGHKRLWNDKGELTGYAIFEAEGLHYFVVYNPNDSIFLRSGGYKTAEERDETMRLVQQYILQEESYKVLEDAPNHYCIRLLDDNGKVLATSVPYASFIEAYTTTPAGSQRTITDGIF